MRILFETPTVAAEDKSIAASAQNSVRPAANTSLSDAERTEHLFRSLEALTGTAQVALSSPASNNAIGQKKKKKHLTSAKPNDQTITGSKRTESDEQIISTERTAPITPVYIVRFV